ncbi:MAG: hypothetical protein AAGG53_07695 [Cyanobacteria bacterium P01_H01_bin.152]
MSLVRESDLILNALVGKHTDAFLDALVVSTEEKTKARLWYTDDWGGYERVLPP